MSTSARILDATLHEIDQNKRWLDGQVALQEVVIRIKFDRKTRRIRFVHLTVETEREVTEITS